jgi:chromosome segregation ATPase
MLEVLASIRNEKTGLLLKMKELRLKLSQIEEREERIKEEIESVEAQIAYYDGLAKDMKKGINPPKLHGLLDHIGRG